MTHTIEDIATALGAEALGAVSLTVTGAAEPASAGPDELALAMTPAYADAIKAGRARAAMVWPGADWQALGLEAAIVAPRARLAMARLTQMLDPGYAGDERIHPSAVISPNAEIGPGAMIGPLCVVGEGAIIGARTQLLAHVTVAPGAVIGEDGLLHAGARVGRRVRIGDRVTVQPNAVIGGDGFSFVTRETANVERARASLGDNRLEPPADPDDAVWHRIHSLGGVEIGDDVEIGSNTSIDAGTIRPTRIGNRSKVDNLVQVAHNDVIGEDCLICGHVGIAGSVTIGDRVVLGGATGVTDNITIGDDVVTGGGTVLLSSVPAGRVMLGYPAVPMARHLESYKALRRLPRILRDLAASKKAVPNDRPSD
ncbi:UDP-3-O-3-hydroxymyristoyl glucosamine N-acyltransferase [Oceanicola granulosus HTCC2516]|uniref:UDP-3-O-acylglucosamine N-acyltransferase n=1 Tax=Oceanicola granulosus (strain ATCC BAA-861 / DSM 15982 / KCTC 12143 / HTCC2516) TaxID=314256 RepID=Q2CG86_OCEGH|nr:UDP-3-O-(3-hydroxymyristoyl)glucosamine N-acyltransferase [Oceanicola granulosus]EAR51643.1 UDP-3-O-3-hydroxymyristoyl glucosamine N-acyltransferase [Oceanicola granulosus HTCC2516]